MNILITGFQPFGGHATNVTELLLKDFTYKKHQVNMRKVIFPVVFNDIRSVLVEAISTYQPDMIIHLGEHSKAEGIELERIAINMIDARIPDNNGMQPIDEPIDKQGESAYFSTLPIRKIESSLIQKNIPVKISNTAGTYVCNHVFYTSLHLQNKNKNRVPTGFIHIPLVKEQDQRSKFDLSYLQHALSLIIDACIITS